MQMCGRRDDPVGKIGHVIARNRCHVHGNVLIDWHVAENCLRVSDSGLNFSQGAGWNSSLLSQVDHLSHAYGGDADLVPIGDGCVDEVRSSRPSRGSAKRYQSAVCVSAIATSIKNQNAENSPTFPRDSGRSLLLMEQRRVLPEGHAKTAWAAFQKLLESNPRRFVPGPHARGRPVRHLWPELLQSASPLPAAPVAK